MNEAQRQAIEELRVTYRRASTTDLLASLGEWERAQWLFPDVMPEYISAAKHACSEAITSRLQ